MAYGLKKMMIGAMAASMLAGGVALTVNAQETREIVTVVKLSGIAWFNRMEEGVKQYAEATGNNATQVGAATADAALQVQLIEDLIARGVDAITVVPNSPQTLEPVLARALE